MLKLTSERVSTLNRSISAACPLTMARAAPKTGLGSYGSLKNKRKKKLTILNLITKTRIWANLQNQKPQLSLQLNKVPNNL